MANGKKSAEVVEARAKQRAEAKAKLHPVSEDEVKEPEVEVAQPAPTLPVIAVFVNADGSFNRAEFPGIPKTAVPAILELAIKQVRKDLGLD